VRAHVDDSLSVASNETPFTLLTAGEPDEDLTPEERRALELKEEAQRRMDVRVRQFVLFGEFVSVGVSEVDVLKMRSLIMLRTCAEGLLRERFGYTVKAAIKEEKRLFHRLPFDLRAFEWVPLAFSLASPLAGSRDSAVDDDEEWCAEELGLEVRELRMRRFGEFCAEIAATCDSVDAFAKTLASLLRRVKTEFISALGQSQADLGRKFNEERATVQAREKRSVEKPLKDQGQAGYKLLGGVKSEAHRRACREAQKGNTNRKDGEVRKARREEQFRTKETQPQQD
jgi:hypothetical protein